MNGKGFTLIEIVVVVAVVAILAGILTPIVAKQITDGKISRAFSDVKVIGAAIGDFYKDNDKWPIYINPSLSLAENNRLDLLVGVGNDAASEGEDTGLWNEGGWGTNFVDRMEDHLVYNEPPSHPVDYDEPKWNGPYIAKITSDPWGSHYSVNARYLNSFYQEEGEVVWVMSPGVNVTWETGFSQLNTSSVNMGGDDIGFRIK